MDTSPSWLTKHSDCERTKVNLSHWNMIDIKINRGCFIAKLTLNPPKCWIKQLQVDIQKNLCVCELLREATLPTWCTALRTLGDLVSWSADPVLSHWPRGWGHPLCLSAAAATEHNKQMHAVSRVGACIWIYGFDHLTRDWDLWSEHLCWQDGEKGISLLSQTHCHWWHLSLSHSYLCAAISLR